MITQHPKATRTKIGEGTLPIRNDSEIANGSLTIPAELTPFVEPCFLLSGESSREFGAIRQMMIDDIQPATNVEWLWTLDLVELSWEILRYRRLKKRILNAHREAAIEAILRRLEGAGMPAEAIPMLQIRTRRTAAEWRCDPEAACDIEARLQRSGIDSIDIDAEVFVQARELFLMFDKLMCSAQNRRIALLREFSIRREFAARVRRVLPGTGRLESSFP